MQTIHAEEGHPLALYETYMAFIRGSVGSRQYKKLYVRTPTGLKDVIGNGDLACALFVSSILTQCGLIKGGIHTTVDETVVDLRDSGWEYIEVLQKGAVIIWEPKLCTDRLCHRHIGFFMGNQRAISNEAKRGVPVEHHFTYGTQSNKPLREIEKILFHKSLRAY